MVMLFENVDEILLKSNSPKNSKVSHENSLHTDD